MRPHVTPRTNQEAGIVYKSPQVPVPGRGVNTGDAMTRGDRYTTSRGPSLPPASWRASRSLLHVCVGGVYEAVLYTYAELNALIS